MAEDKNVLPPGKEAAWATWRNRCADKLIQDAQKLGFHTDLGWLIEKALLRKIDERYATGAKKVEALLGEPTAITLDSLQERKFAIKDPKVAVLSGFNRMLEADPSNEVIKAMRDAFLATLNV